MKMTKRIISAILAVTLLLSIAAPAFAADSEPNDPNLMPVITKQPKNTRLSAEPKEAHFVVGIQAHIPNGDQVCFRLYYINEVTGEDMLIQDDTIPTISGGYESGEYYLEVYNRDHPEYCVTSETFILEVYEPSAFEKAYKSLMGELGALALVSSFTPLGIIAIPFAMIITSIQNLLFPRFF